MKNYGLLILFFFISLCVYAETLTGIPIKKIEIVNSVSNEYLMNEEQMGEYKLVLKKDDQGNYYWESRDTQMLIKNTSGIFLIFSAANGAGYVKINSETNEYIEHIHLGLDSITYFGRILAQG